MRKSILLAISAVLSGCSPSPMVGPDSAEPLSKLPINAPCTGTVAQYCGGTQCPTYEAAVARRAAYCAHPGQQSLQTHQCAGLYRTVSWRDTALGGGDEYFDDAGRLVAASLVSDYGSQYCGRSFTQTLGTIPECPGAVVSTSLCD